MDDGLDPDADCFKPPPRNVLVQCIHSGEEYDSYRIEWGGGKRVRAKNKR